MTSEKTLLNELRLVHIALRRCMSAQSDDGLQVPRVASMVLNYIFMQGGSATQKEVEAEFGMRRSTLSRLISRLEEEGYAERTVSATDGRSKLVTLSEKARAEQERISEKFRVVEEWLESAFTDEEKEGFFAFSEKMQKLFESHGNTHKA